MKAIYFDWGGVVAADPGDDFFIDILQSTGASHSQISEIVHRYLTPLMKGQLTDLGLWAKLRQEYGLVFDDSISQQFQQWPGLKAEPHLLSVVKKAKRKGWQTGLLTNVIQPTYDLLRSAGYYDRFDQVIASCREGVAKPDSQIYHIALRRLGATASQSIFIDDKQSNLQPARDMGFTVILAKNTSQTVQAIEALLDT